MKLFIVSVLVAVATAKPSGILAPLTYSAPVAVAAISTPVATQYHSQDELGQYSYGYSNAQSAKAEARAANGLTVGGYTYVDPEGKLQSVEYSSDANGFRVAASNLPVPPAVPVAPVLPVPVPVQDTPEVVEARAKHLEAVEAFKTQSAELIASAPVVSTVVKSISPIVPAAQLVAAPVITAAPLAAVKSAVVVEPAQPSAELSTEAPSTPAPVEDVSVAAPEAKSADASAPAATPAGVSVLSTPAIGVRSLVTPALPVGVAPLVPAPAAYSINALHPFGFSSIVAQPALTTYSAQILTSVPGSVVQTSETSSPAKNPEQSSE
ncbi:calphotin-like [Anoplophora glabripennis]|uniref:calphotin-like n=1 Tax=Anoplophora glabripennis TaxID=217634 RepID=UPI000873E571|nr:calphotin-like [Anoplophora glabripennis]